MPKGIGNRQYTPESKKILVETMPLEHLSYTETPRRFEVSSHRRIQDWERIYLEEGPEGLVLGDERRQHKKTLAVQKNSL